MRPVYFIVTDLSLFARAKLERTIAASSGEALDRAPAVFSLPPTADPYFVPVAA